MEKDRVTDRKRERERQRQELNVFLMTNLLFSNRWCIKSWQGQIQTTAVRVFVCARVCVCVVLISLGYPSSTHLNISINASLKINMGEPSECPGLGGSVEQLDVNQDSCVYSEGSVTSLRQLIWFINSLLLGRTENISIEKKRFG